MIARLGVSIGMFAALLLAINIIHFRFFTVDVVLYSTLLDAGIAALLSTAICWYGIFKRDIAPVIFGQLVVIFLLGGYSYAITIPTIIDRSYSVYLLEKLQQQGGAIRQSAFDNDIILTFTREHRLTDARLTEQLASGTITVENGCVKLTEKGERTATLTRWHRTHMLPKKRLLMGAYSDALTDPFRDVKIDKNLGCKN